MATKNNETLGRRIARMRLAHGMTQERLANIANVSAQAVSKWENDQSYPDILLLPVLAEAFDVSIDELLGVERTAPTQATVEPASEAEQAVAVEPTLVTPRVAEEPSEPIGVTPDNNRAAFSEAEEPAEPSPESEPTPAAEEPFDIDQPATRIRLHVIRDGKDAVNLTLPLAAARLVSNVAAYFPERLIEGVDIAGIFASAQNAGRGTLVDVNDNADHVIITLE